MKNSTYVNFLDQTVSSKTWLKNPSEVVKLSEEGRNTIYLVDRRFIYKMYCSPDQLVQEKIGYHTFKLVSPSVIPLIIDQGENYLVCQYIRSQSAYDAFRSNLITRKRISQNAASFIAEVYWRYQRFDRGQLDFFPWISWEKRLNRMVKTFQQNEPKLQRLIGLTKVHLINQQLGKVLPSFHFLNTRTFLHRDLHLDNILLKNPNSQRAQIYFIDFEHCLEGPIEFELQNSIFWHDEKSLDVSTVQHELVDRYQIPYSHQLERGLRVLYYIDQLNLAIKAGAENKIKKLVQKYHSRET